MRLRIIYLCLYATFFSTTLNAQDSLFSGFLSPNIDNSVYTTMQNIWYANERPSYLCFAPFFFNQLNPVVPLREGEGKKSFHILEGNLYYQIPIVMGRNHMNHPRQTKRLTFNTGFNFRMAADSSSPLVPNNNIFGLTGDMVLWNSHTKRVRKGNKKNFAFEDWKAKNNPLHNLSLEITANHYSNGQQHGFFLRDTINGVPVKRNDYKKGDFSTNYLRVGFTYSFLSRERNLFSANVAYQLDLNLFGPLRYSVEQEKSYGHHRITSFLQYKLLLKKNSFPCTVWDVCNKITVQKQLHSYHEITIRFEPAFILGDLSEYKVPTNKKYRFSQHIYIEYTRPNFRHFSFLLHFYSGRDYSNIRYDMPIVAVMGGIGMHFNKYYPAFSEKQTFGSAIKRKTKIGGDSQLSSFEEYEE